MNVFWSGYFEENIFVRKLNNIIIYKIFDKSYSVYFYSFFYLIYVCWLINNILESVVVVFVEYFLLRYYIE